MAGPITSFRDLVRVELPRLYAFAYHMCCDRAEAEQQLHQLVRHVGSGVEAKIMADGDPAQALLGLLARKLEENLNRKADHTFEGLDKILRSDITRPIDLNASEIATDPARVHVMLWELKRTCLTATLGCLPPGVRISFVLTDLLGYSPADAAVLLDIKESAYRVRLTRARKRIEDYLAPRCFHVDRQNPCTCSGRLGIAIDAGFIRLPIVTIDIPHQPHDSDGPRRDLGSLYRSLPPVQLTDDEMQRFMETVPDGAA